MRRALSAAEAGDYPGAREHFERALALDGTSAEVCTDLANVYRALGDTARAEALYARALQINPDAALAHLNLALMLRGRGEAARALAHLERAHALAPARGEILRMLEITLLEREDFEAAERIAERATQATPELYEAWLSLGLVRQKLHRSHEALAAYARALALRSDDAELFNNRAIAWQHVGRFAEALADYDTALELDPASPNARFHRALLRLSAGDYAAGWPDYEIRLLSKDSALPPPRLPRWDGAPGRRVLVRGEQGLGDEIMFGSCVPDLMRVSAGCVLTCAPKLVPIFQRSFAAARVLSREDGAAVERAEQDTDCEIPIGSLPLHFRRDAADFPAYPGAGHTPHAGYLAADPQRVSAWRERLAALGPGLKVGLSWRGGTHKSRRPVRSLDLGRLAPVLGLAGVRFVSLQYTEEAQADVDAFRRESGIDIAHWPEAIADYDETAALVAALDLTLSVCTAVIHLAGALGKPVWVMAPYSPEWRYGQAGERMPWYPAARVIRQSAYADWDSVIATVATRLARAAGGVNRSAAAESTRSV